MEERGGKQQEGNDCHHAGDDRILEELVSERILANPILRFHQLDADAEQADDATSGDQSAGIERARTDFTFFVRGTLARRSLFHDPAH